MLTSRPATKLIDRRNDRNRIEESDRREMIRYGMKANRTGTDMTKQLRKKIRKFANKMEIEMTRTDFIRKSNFHIKVRTLTWNHVITTWPMITIMMDLYCTHHANTMTIYHKPVQTQVLTLIGNHMTTTWPISTIITDMGSTHYADYNDISQAYDNQSPKFNRKSRDYHVTHVHHHVGYVLYT